MNTEQLTKLQTISDLMIVVASASVCATFVWVLIGVRGRIGGRIRPLTLMCVFVIALSATHLAAYAIAAFPEVSVLYFIQMMAAVVSLVMALAVWPLLPQMRAQPTHNELVLANARLLEEQNKRAEVVEQLRRMNEELETRVAERTSELEAARRRFEIAIAGTNIVVAQQDRDLRYTWIYNAPEPLENIDVEGRTPEEVLPPSTAQAQHDVKLRVLQTGEAERFEVPYPTSRGTLWYEGRVEPLFVDGRIDGVMTVSIDITRHKENEYASREMMRELTHRSKNLLAIVQAIARQSMAGTADLPDFIEAFNARLQTLSGAHELLIAGGWRGAPLRVIVERELAILSEFPIRARIGGVDAMLNPEATQNFALGIHELLFDIRKAARGRIIEVAIDWRVEDEKFVFDWARTGEGADNSVNGFGRVFLEQILPRSAGGSALFSERDGQTSYHFVANADRILRALG